MLFRSKRSLEITSTAAMHWSARTPLDTNQSLWCSYVVKGIQDSYFHWYIRFFSPPANSSLYLCSGDTGFSAGLFNAIGRLFGPITLATLPIGAYFPRWRTCLLVFPSLCFANAKVHLLRPRSRAHEPRGRRQGAPPSLRCCPRLLILLKILQAHRAIGAKFSVGVHHSTWCLSDEHYLAPPADLAIAREQVGLTEKDFCVVPQGRTLVL